MGRPLIRFFVNRSKNTFLFMGKEDLLPKFKLDEYHDWAFNMSAFLQAKSVFGAIDEESNQWATLRKPPCDQRPSTISSSPLEMTTTPLFRLQRLPVQLLTLRIILFEKRIFF